MRRHRITTAFSLSTVALFLATLVIQPLSLAQVEVGKSEFTRSTTEGGGFTRDPAKVGSNDSATFTQYQSFDQAEFESGVVAPETDEEGPIEAEPQPMMVNPTLPGGVDHAAAGTGTRNAGHGTIRLRGVPAGATVVRAWLYWGTVYPATAIPNNPTATFNGTTVTGAKINPPTLEPCWLFNNARFAAYRANVRPLIPPAINGDYKVSGLASAITNGTDPFVCVPPFPTPPTPASEGATLLVIYSHGSVPSSARTYIHQGPALVTGNTTVTNNLSPLLPTHSVIKQTRFGADGQVGCSQFSVPILNGEKTSLGPNVNSLVQIKGPGSTINTNSDWNGGDGLTLNQLWDTQTDAFGSVNGVTNLIPAGSAQYVVRYTGVGDCFVTVVHVLTAK